MHPGHRAVRAENRLFFDFAQILEFYLLDFQVYKNSFIHFAFFICINRYYNPLQTLCLC